MLIQNFVYLPKVEKLVARCKRCDTGKYLSLLDGNIIISEHDFDCIVTAYKEMLAKEEEQRAAQTQS